jgi:hypothetical protein
MSQDALSQPLSELDLLDRYVGVRSAQFAREGHQLWIINGCAQGQIALASMCARWAHDRGDGQISPPARILNLASDEYTLQALEQALEPYQSVSVNVFGSLEQSLERVLRTVGPSPTFVMLDPLDCGGIRIDVLARLNSRRGAKTELLLTLAANSLGDLTAAFPPERLDRVIGSSLWRRLSRNDDDLSNLTRVAVLYRACLQRRGYAYARKIQLRTVDGAQPTCQLVFATRSQASLALMSHLVCGYQRACQQTVPRLSELADRICRYGAQLGDASTNQIVRGLSGDLFGQFTAEEYRQTIRDLVTRGAILAADEQNLTDEQKLTFSASSQMALFDTEAPQHAASAGQGA